MCGLPGHTYDDSGFLLKARAWQCATTRPWTHHCRVVWQSHARGQQGSGPVVTEAPRLTASKRRDVWAPLQGGWIEPRVANAAHELWRAAWQQHRSAGHALTPMAPLSLVPRSSVSCAAQKKDAGRGGSESRFFLDNDGRLILFPIGASSAVRLASTVQVE